MPDPALKSVDGNQPIREVPGLRLRTDKGDSRGAGAPQSSGRDCIAMDTTELVAASADPSPSTSSSCSFTSTAVGTVTGLSSNSRGGRNQNSRDAGRGCGCCCGGSGGSNSAKPRDADLPRNASDPSPECSAGASAESSDDRSGEDRTCCVQDVSLQRRFSSRYFFSPRVFKSSNSFLAAAKYCHCHHEAGGNCLRLSCHMCSTSTSNLEP